MLKAPVRLGQAALELLFPSSCFGCGRHDVSCVRHVRSLWPRWNFLTARPAPSPFMPAAAAGNARPPPCAGRHPRSLPHGRRHPRGDPWVEVRQPQGRGTSPGWTVGEVARIEPRSRRVIVPVPLHRRRLPDRGYNQSALLAREVARIVGLPAAPDVLVRTRDSLPQVSLSTREERVRNVEGSFLCVGNARGKRFILVDDVVTTGSTMSACAVALREAGARSVWGVTLARQRHGGR